MSPRGYLVRHWRGEFPLSVSFWINGVLLLAAIHAALAVAHAGIEKSESTPRLISYASLALFPVLVAVWVWALAGTWRSANRHATETVPNWPSIAKMVIACVLIGIAAQLATGVLPQLLTRDFY